MKTRTDFFREPRSDGKYNYRFAADPRFSIWCTTKTGYAGSHGSSPIFGRTDSDGNTYVTGWYVKFEGSTKVFSPGKLADLKAKVLDPGFRAWVLERAGHLQPRVSRAQPQGGSTMITIHPAALKAIAAELHGHTCTVAIAPAGDRGVIVTEYAGYGESSYFVSDAGDVVGAGLGENVTTYDAVDEAAV